MDVWRKQKAEAIAMSRFATPTTTSAVRSVIINWVCLKRIELCCLVLSGLMVVSDVQLERQARLYLEGLDTALSDFSNSTEEFGHLFLVELRAIAFWLRNSLCSELDVADYSGRVAEHGLTLLNSEIVDYAVANTTDEISQTFLGVGRWFERT